MQPRSNIVKRHARVEEEESNEEDEECDAQGLDDEANIGYDESNYEEVMKKKVVPNQVVNL